MNFKSLYVEVHVFRIKNSKLEFLVLKRSKGQKYSGIWQMVTGKIKQGEKAYETVLREVKEETKLTVKNLWVVPNVNSFYNPKEDAIYHIPVFAAQVVNDINVKLSKEHCRYIWCKPEEAVKLFAWEGQKNSMRIFEDYYLNKKEYLKLLKITF